jgi:hypothetical protein
MCRRYLMTSRAPEEQRFQAKDADRAGRSTGGAPAAATALATSRGHVRIAVKRK